MSAFDGWDGLGTVPWNQAFSYGYNMLGNWPTPLDPHGLGERPYNPATGGIDAKTHENEVVLPSSMFVVTDSDTNVQWDTVFHPNGHEPFFAHGVFGNTNDFEIRVIDFFV